MTGARDSVTVTQADRDAAAACARYFGHDFTAVEVEVGEADICTLVAIVSRHREAAQAELVEALEAMLRRWEASYNNWRHAVLEAATSDEKAAITNTALAALSGFPIEAARSTLSKINGGVA